MKVVSIKGQTYRLPGGLSKWQTVMYIHLINWKWKNITKVVGYNNYKGRRILYDAFFPDSIKYNLPHIYNNIRGVVLQHQKNFFFKFHKYFYHMASSQAANINLFLPVLLSPHANSILKLLKSDFKQLASNELDNGYRIEFWDGMGKEKGILNDHTPVAGTDSDIAIAYYNKDNDLCLWLIEHKLTEKGFTTCGGAKSKGRTSQHNCNKSFTDLIKNKDFCYYHIGCKYEYWNITQANRLFFVNHKKFESCPFKGGMNQLWRNQLLSMAMEKSGKYKHVYFSVVHHPDNFALDNSINEYKQLINHNPKFSAFNSKDVINAASMVTDIELHKWIKWYKELYNI